MGFLETIGKLMLKLTGLEGQQEQRIKEWEESLTPEMIKEYEKQGIDTTEYWKTYERVQKEKQERLEARQNCIDLEKLSIYIPTPRDAESDFIKDTVKINTTPLFGKKDWIERMCKAPMVYGAVVQAHSSLYESNTENELLGVVVTFSPDPAYTHNVEWLTGIADKIGELKESGNVPADCKNLIFTLRDSQSQFCFKVGESVTGGPEVWCATMTINNQKDLPQACMPANNILPLLLSDKLEENLSASLDLVPAKYYTK